MTSVRPVERRSLGDGADRDGQNWKQQGDAIGKTNELVSWRSSPFGPTEAPECHGPRQPGFQGSEVRGLLCPLRAGR